MRGGRARRPYQDTREPPHAPPRNRLLSFPGERDTQGNVRLRRGGMAAAAARNEFEGMMAFDSDLLTAREKQLLRDAGMRSPLDFLAEKPTATVMELLTTICNLRLAAKAPR